MSGLILLRGRGLILAAMGVSLALASCSKKGVNDYVVTPDELTKDFIRKHPGPGWVLARDDQFKLAPEQKSMIGALGNKLSADLASAGTAVRKAYDAFRRDAQDPDADRERLFADVETLAGAQTAMTKIVVAAHYQLFADLDPGQQKTFRQLVACCGPPP